jgi:hypothetical protein
VPTATFRVLFVFAGLSHERRHVLHFQGTEQPTQKWTRQQIREAFPWKQVPRYLLHDRDAIYGRDFPTLTPALRMQEVITAPRCPWQNPSAERLIGSVRRECLDYVIVWNQRSSHRILQNYFAYYQHSRGTIVFASGGSVFVQGAWRELSSRQPGMIPLVSLAILVDFSAWLASSVGPSKLTSGGNSRH